MTKIKKTTTSKTPRMPPRRNDPVGQDKRIVSALKPVDRKLDEIKRWLVTEISRASVEVLNANYRFQVDLVTLTSLIERLQKELSGVEGSLTPSVIDAYTQGAVLAEENLAGLTDDLTRQRTRVATSTPVVQRAALQGARVLEEMKGMTADLKSSITRVLTDSVLKGENPRRVARKLAKEFDLSKVRARRIARTEITTSLRRGRWDAAQETQERLGLRTGLMHVSALSPTTRPSHAARHGRVYTIDEVRDWYEKDGNSINCKCTQIEVLLDKDGKATSTKLVERMAAARESYKKGLEE